MSDDLEIVHPVPELEIPGWLGTMATTFLHDPGGEGTGAYEQALVRDWEPERSWGARERGRWVATLRTFDRTITVPGLDGETELLVADALTNVTVAATHRRRGLLSGMLTASLEAARERGDAVSILIAAEWPIYGRFGYAPATFLSRRVLHSGRPGSVVAGDPHRVRQVDPDEFLAAAPTVFEAGRRRRPGQVDRDAAWWTRAFGRDGDPVVERPPHNLLVRDGDDGPDGLLAWSATRDAKLLWPRGAIEAFPAPVAAGPDAERDLWAYLGGIDLVDEVVTYGPLDDELRWLLPDARTLVSTETFDYTWLRLLDVPVALAARRYAVSGELVLEVADRSAVSVAGRYRLRADGAAVTCERCTAEPDLTLAQTALAAAYLGGFGLREQAIAGTVTEHVPGALRRADAMFATPLAPLNWTGF